MEGFLRYINNIVEQSSDAGLQPLYSLAGTPHIEETLIASPPGHRNMGPVRVGNLAAKQRQHDVSGSTMCMDRSCWAPAPQTYSMVGVISSALLLSRSWEEGV